MISVVILLVNRPYIELKLWSCELSTLILEFNGNLQLFILNIEYIYSLNIKV